MGGQFAPEETGYFIWRDQFDHSHHWFSSSIHPIWFSILQLLFYIPEFPPVISFTLLKKAFFRSELIPQSTGTLW